MRRLDNAIPLALCLAILGTVLITGCRHVTNGSHDIVLDGFSDRNYLNLDRSLGSPVCIRGKVIIDRFHGGVYFPLQTNKNKEVITIGLSRIISGLTYDYARRNAMVGGKSYRVCGTLRYATPFRHCDDNDCKWYRMENPELP
jgi:hypothetical protein